MWQSKREISRECNDIIGSAKGSQISEKYWGKVGKGKRADIYLEVRKRRRHIFFEWNKCLWFQCNPNYLISLRLGFRRKFLSVSSSYTVQTEIFFGILISTRLLISELSNMLTLESRSQGVTNSLEEHERMKIQTENFFGILISTRLENEMLIFINTISDSCAGNVKKMWHRFSITRPFSISTTALHLPLCNVYYHSWRSFVYLVRIHYYCTLKCFVYVLCTRKSAGVVNFLATSWKLATSNFRCRKMFSYLMKISYLQLPVANFHTAEL